MSELHHFAIMAPVPLEHLQSGEAVSRQKDFVAFGTMKWDLFQRIDEMRGDGRVAVLIYPSREDVPAKDAFVICWFGWYSGMNRPNMISHRPPTTAQDGHWAAFWCVSGLRSLPKEKQISIGKIQGFKGGWRKDKPPRGPELVTLPELLSYEK